MSSEDKEADSKSKYTISNNSLSSDTMITSKQQNKFNSNTLTDDNNNNNNDKNQCIATFQIQSTTFKKRKKRSKSKNIIKPSAPSNTTNSKKRKLSDIKNEENERDSMIIKNSQINSKKKRRKLTNEFSTDKITQNANNTTMISYESERCVLPFGLEGQGAAVEVYVEDKDKNKRIDNKPSVTSNGYIRYNGLKASKPVRSAPKFLGIGPQRAPDNVKITCRFDYQPDICKDWKETGFCGYGQSCKFLHDRTDYKAGWQIERDWEKFQKREKEKLAGNNNVEEEEEENWEIHSDDDEDEEGGNMDDDGLPFACYICRDGFVEPVVTKCGHYFCSQCAIKKYAKSDGCAACGAKTEGSFQTATKLIKKLKKRKR